MRASGIPRCPDHGVDLTAQTVSQMVDQVLKLPEGESCLLLAPLVAARKGEHHEVLADLTAQGFVRVRIDGTTYEIDAAPELDPKRKHDIEAVVDRFKVRPDIAQRLAESFETALRLGNGIARLALAHGKREETDVLQQACLPGLRLQRGRAGAQAVFVQQPDRCLPDLRWPGLPGVLRSRARGDASATVAGRWRHPWLGSAQCLLLPDDPRAGRALQIRHRSAVDQPCRRNVQTMVLHGSGDHGHRVQVHRLTRPGGQSARIPSKASSRTWNAAIARPSP